MQQWLPRWPLQLRAQQWWLTLKERGLGQARMRPRRCPLLPQVLAQGQAQRQLIRFFPLLHQVLEQGQAQPERRAQQL